MSKCWVETSFFQAKASKQCFIFYLIIGFFEAESKGTTELNTLGANQNHSCFSAGFCWRSVHEHGPLHSRNWGWSVAWYINLAIKSASACSFITVLGLNWMSNSPNSIAYFASRLEASRGLALVGTWSGWQCCAPGSKDTTATIKANASFSISR